MNAFSPADERVNRYTQWIIRWRIPVVIATVLLTLLAGSGGRFLSFSTDYRAFFSKENPQLTAFESLQNIYTKNDNILFVLEPADGEVFTPHTLQMVEELTDEAWKVPFAIRVDAITNFQHTRANEDDLIVEDLVEDAASKTPAELEYAKRVALDEPVLFNRLIPEDASVTGVNVTVQLPGKDINEVPTAVAYARDLKAQFEAKYPDIKIRMTGMTMMNNAFSEAGQGDMKSLVPFMYLIIFLMMFLMLRSMSAVVAALFVIALSTVGAMGLAGWAGIQLTPPSAQAPTMIMTLAVADSIHILVTMFTEMRRGRDKREAIIESLRINMQPVFLTSLTTAIGFLSMNFSDAPPFRHLGNITAMGVAIAFILSVTFLPAFLSMLPLKARVSKRERAREASGAGAAMPLGWLSTFVIDKRRPLLWASVILVLVMGAFIPQNKLNDQFVEYFDTRIDFRNDTDFAMERLTGIYQIEHSLGAEESGGISDPEYLATIEAFANWYKEHELVTHVNTFSDVMKRVNKSLHGDDESYYHVPDNRELAAQYLLLYEMSLPYGLDLNNQINIDKSATRFTVTMHNTSTNEVRALAAEAEQWLRDNAPPSMFSEGSGTTVMFSYISERNIKSMLTGTALAILLIAGTLVIALRSVKFGLLNLIPNLVPAVIAFGVWGILVSEIGLALSIVVAMTLGIVVDDSVHFMSKYLRARRENGYDPEAAVRYAFATVGKALIVTTLILAAGFMVLTLSSFKLNSGMGQLTAITIVIALIMDFLMLPPILMLWADRKATIEESKEVVSNEYAEPITESL